MPGSGIVVPDETELHFFVDTFSAYEKGPSLAVAKATSQLRAWLSKHPNAENVEMQPTQSQGVSPSYPDGGYWYSTLVTCYLREKVTRRPLVERLQEKRL